MPLELKDSANPDRSTVVDGKKFLWDGGFFESYEEASGRAEAYKSENFEVHLLERGGKYLVYTRRVTKESVVAAPA